MVSCLSITVLQSSYRVAIHSEGMVKDLVTNLNRDNEELQMHCASAIFKVAVFGFRIGLSADDPAAVIRRGGLLIHAEAGH